MAEQVEGAPLLREYGLKRSIEGSNPSLSANGYSKLLILKRFLFKGFSCLQISLQIAMHSLYARHEGAPQLICSC